MTDEKVKAKEGKMKWEGGSITCNCMCYTKLWWEATPLWSSKSPHESHSACSLYILLSLFIFLLSPLGLWLCAWLSFFVSVCFSTVTCTCPRALSATWDVPERNVVHLSQFLHLYTLPATWCFISHCVFTPVSVSWSDHAADCWGSSLRLMCFRTNMHVIR